MRKAPPRRIAILYPASSASTMARTLGGIRRYARAQAQDWRLTNSPSALYGELGLIPALASMREWKGDGIIGSCNDNAELRQLKQMGFPVVNVSGHLRDCPGIPRVTVDDVEAGRLAADHLLRQGLRHLAFLGRKGPWYSELRLLGFRQRAAESGLECPSLLQGSFEPSRQSWQERLGVIASWIASLPRPTGIFAVHDFRAQLLLEACEEAKLRIPDDLAVVGCNNDETICENTIPTLTSVSPDFERVGWEAAALLHRMLEGEPAPTADLRVAPGGIIKRNSTERLYCADSAVERAVDFMKTQMKTAFNIEQVARHAGVSKRTIETRFRGNFQTSPHDFLTNVRVQEAQRLLQTPRKWTLEGIALECGFGSVKPFNAAFRRITGESPTAFRKRHALGRTLHGD